MVFPFLLRNRKLRFIVASFGHCKEPKAMRGAVRSGSK